MASPLSTATAENDTTASPRRATLFARWGDAHNLAIIIAGWALLLLLVPYPHDFTTTDDQVYAGAVRDFLESGTLRTPNIAQANLVGQTVWGALWSSLFGFSLTTLTASTLFLAAVALLLFYGIVRELGAAGLAALFGTALLGLNPIFVHLSYSFMTDVPFLTLLLAATYCFLKAAKGDGWGEGTSWAVAGSFMASWCYMIRQFAVLAPLAFGTYLLVEGLLGRRWKAAWWWARLLAVTIIPLSVFLWHTTAIPPTRSAELGLRRAELFLFKEPWPRVFLLRALSALPIIALFTWGALNLSWRHRWLVLIVGIAIVFGMSALDLPDERWIQQIEPPFTAHLGPFAYDFPDEPYTFGAYGNILRVTGIDFDEFFYTQQPIWDAKVWRYFHLFGVGLGVLLVSTLCIAFYRWVSEFARNRSLTPLAGFYWLGYIVFVVSLAFPGEYFDRYTLAFFPFFIVFIVRGAQGWGRRAWGYSLAGLAMIAIFTVLAKADHMDHNNTRWDAVRWMAERTGEVKGGWNPNHWGYKDSDTYRVDDRLADGFRIERQFAYTCRLCGFTTRYVLAQSTADAPPLPAGP